MRRIALLVFLLAAAAVASGQENLLEKGFGGRAADDAISRKYLTPLRLVALPEASTAGVDNAGALLGPFDGQLSVGTPDVCRLSTRGGRAASVLLDFGKEIYGGIEIAAAIRSDQRALKVRIRYGESVSEAMSDVGGDAPMASATNEHSLRDFTLGVPWLGTVETGNSGFRFVRIDLVEPDAELNLKSVRGILRYRDIPYLGSFRCDDERLTRIWETGAYTVHLNMQDYLWDGIKRDRLVWVGDMHPEVMTIQSVFGGNGVVRKSLDHVRDNTPLPGWMNHIAAYSMWWVIIHRDLYLYGGDLGYLQAQQEYMKELFAVLAANMDGDRENLQGGAQRLLDWPTSEMPGVIHAGYQALLVRTMEAGVEIGGWLRDRQMQAGCRAALKRLRRHVPDHGQNKQAAAMLVLAGMADPDEVCGPVIARGGAEGFSTFYGYYMLEALAAGGLYGDAMRIISDYWGAMLDLGATTFWEDLNYAHAARAARIDEPVPAGEFDIHAQSGAYCYKGLRHSFCHGWASGPTAWLSRYVLGIEPLEPGCRAVAVRPNLGSLKWAEGTFPTPYGVIRVRHERDAAGKVVSTVSAPEEVRIVR